MEYVLNLSYGKDSMACLGAIKQLNWPLDRIVTVDVWATQDVLAELPPMIEFKKYADEKIKDMFGIQVEHFCAMKNGQKVTFEDVFYKKRTKSKGDNKLHDIHGWPFQKGPWCNDRLKTNVLDSIKDAVSYIGIAADELNRFHCLNQFNKSPLVELGWDENKCRSWCEENNLLSPIYSSSLRAGCWFCHNQSVSDLRNLYKNYRQLWDLMLKWDLDSPVTFKSGKMIYKKRDGKNISCGYVEGRTLHDFDTRFRLEEEGRIDLDKRFMWKNIGIGV